MAYVSVLPSGTDSLFRLLRDSDELVATASAGTVSNNGVNYATTVQNITGLLAPGADGVNHGASSGLLTCKRY